MQLHEVKVIDTVSTVSAANQRLSDGWTLIAVVGDGNGARYVFGRGEAAPVRESVGLTAADLARANQGL